MPASPCPVSTASSPSRATTTRACASASESAPPPAASPWVPSLRPSFWALVCSAVRRPWPTIAEAGVLGYEATSWFGMFAPAGTPAPVLAKLNAAIVKVQKSPEFEQATQRDGSLVFITPSPATFADWVRKEFELWRGLVAQTGAKVE